MSRRALSSRVVERCRVVVDNDFAGDPDGLLALAHHLLSPSNRVVGITSSFLDERLLGQLGTAGRTAAEGVDAVVTLLDQIQPMVRPPVWAGAEAPWTPDAQPSAASEAIVAEARADSPLPLVVVCGGPLTNVAAALLQDPGIVDRLSLVWIGGSLTPDTFEYNRDTDPSAAESVFRTGGLQIHQIPLQTYRRCAFSVVELEEDLPATGRLGAWLCDRFQDPPDWVDLGGVWPLGDSPPLLVTALTTESSVAIPAGVSGPSFPSPGDGVTAWVYTDVDMRLLVGDLVAKLRRHERERLATARRVER